MDPVLICHLREIMAKLNLPMREVARRCGVCHDAVILLCRNEFQKLNAGVIARICGGLGLQMEQLFSVYVPEPWYPVRLHKELTVHLGFNTFPLPPSLERLTEDCRFGRPFVGAWDVRTVFALQNHLNAFGEVAVTFREHDVAAGTNPCAVDEIFEKGGDHVVIGSPIANRLAEFVICRMYNVPPFTTRRRSEFPYTFVWDSRICTPSSFGEKGQDGEFGIVSTRTGRLVARRTFVAEGEGEDCGLIVVFRVFLPPVRRHFGRHDCCIVVCCLGHSGPGTLATLEVVRDPRYGKALFPESFDRPLMRVVSATYTRDPGARGLDNRRLTSWRLVDDDCAPVDTAP